jgi:hypothetical protein
MHLRENRKEREKAGLPQCYSLYCGINQENALSIFFFYQNDHPITYNLLTGNYFTSPLNAGPGCQPIHAPRSNQWWRSIYLENIRKILCVPVHRK